jgi:hypothetical protein
MFDDSLEGDGCEPPGASPYLVLEPGQRFGSGSNEPPVEGGPQELEHVNHRNDAGLGWPRPTRCRPEWTAPGDRRLRPVSVDQPGSRSLRRIRSGRRLCLRPLQTPGHADALGISYSNFNGQKLGKDLHLLVIGTAGRTREGSPRPEDQGDPSALRTDCSPRQIVTFPFLVTDRS